MNTNRSACTSQNGVIPWFNYSWLRKTKRLCKMFLPNRLEPLDFAQEASNLSFRRSVAECSFCENQTDKNIENNLGLDSVPSYFDSHTIPLYFNKSHKLSKQNKFLKLLQNSSLFQDFKSTTTTEGILRKYTSTIDSFVSNNLGPYFNLFNFFVKSYSHLNSNKLLDRIAMSDSNPKITCEFLSKTGAYDIMEKLKEKFVCAEESGLRTVLYSCEDTCVSAQAASNCISESKPVFNGNDASFHSQCQFIYDSCSDNSDSETESGFEESSDEVSDDDFISFEYTNFTETSVCSTNRNFFSSSRLLHRNISSRNKSNSESSDDSILFCDTAENRIGAISEIYMKTRTVATASSFWARSNSESSEDSILFCDNEDDASLYDEDSLSEINDRWFEIYKYKESKVEHTKKVNLLVSIK